MRALLRLATLAGITLFVSSCFAVTDLDRFETKEAKLSNFSDLKLSLRGMTSHVNEFFEYRVVDANNTIQSRGIALPLGGVEASFYAPGAVPKLNGPFRLDFWADHDHSGGYTPPVGSDYPDHAWQVDLGPPDDQNAIVVSFDHNTSFDNLALPTPTVFGKDLSVHLVNLGSLMGRRLEIRVADSSVGRVVALYRVPVVDKADFFAVVPGMIESGVPYSVEVYTDDGKGGAITSFRYVATSDDKGLSTTFDPAVAPKVTDAPAP